MNANATEIKQTKRFGVVGVVGGVVEDKTDTPHHLFIDCLSIQKNKEKKQDIWKDSLYKDLVKLQSNNAGIVGETFIQRICEQSGIYAKIDGSKTKKIGGGDGYINDKIVEIKTAHQGCTSNSFQHELGENPWNAEYIIFVDITPTCIYLTIFKNFNEELYKNGTKCAPYFPTKGITWRKKSGAFKLDTTITINEKNIINGYTFKITQNVDFQKLKEFIELHINSN